MINSFILFFVFVSVQAGSYYTTFNNGTNVPFNHSSIYFSYTGIGDATICFSKFCIDFGVYSDHTSVVVALNGSVISNFKLGLSQTNANLFMLRTILENNNIVYNFFQLNTTQLDSANYYSFYKYTVDAVFDTLQVSSNYDRYILWHIDDTYVFQYPFDDRLKNLKSLLAYQSDVYRDILLRLIFSKMGLFRTKAKFYKFFDNNLDCYSVVTADWWRHLQCASRSVCGPIKYYNFKSTWYGYSIGLCYPYVCGYTSVKTHGCYYESPFVYYYLPSLITVQNFDFSFPVSGSIYTVSDHAFIPYFFNGNTSLSYACYQNLYSDNDWGDEPDNVDFAIGDASASITYIDNLNCLFKNMSIFDYLLQSYIPVSTIEISFNKLSNYKVGDMEVKQSGSVYNEDVLIDCEEFIYLTNDYAYGFSNFGILNKCKQHVEFKSVNLLVTHMNKSVVRSILEEIMQFIYDLFSDLLFFIFQNFYYYFGKYLDEFIIDGVFMFIITIITFNSLSYSIFISLFGIFVKWFFIRLNNYS